MEFSTQQILTLLSTGMAGVAISAFFNGQEWFKELDPTKKITVVAFVSSILGLFATALLRSIPAETFVMLDTAIKPYLASLSLLASALLPILSSQATYAIRRWLNKKQDVTTA